MKLEVNLDFAKNDDLVTETFQYHESHIAEKKIQLNRYDRFYREVCGPLPYLEVKKFIDELNSLCVNEKGQVDQTI